MPERLREIGWTRHEAISDSKLQISYYRTTDDGRIVYGKGGWGIALDDRIGARFDRDEKRARDVARALHEIYPMLADVPIAADWCGPIDRTRTGIPIFGHLGGRSHIVYGVGFSGNGVAPARRRRQDPRVARARHRRRVERMRARRRQAGPLPARSRALPRRARRARGRGAQGGGRDGRPHAEPARRRARAPRARGHDPEEGRVVPARLRLRRLGEPRQARQALVPARADARHPVDRVAERLAAGVEAGLAPDALALDEARGREQREVLRDGLARHGQVAGELARSRLAAGGDAHEHGAPRVVRERAEDGAGVDHACASARGAADAAAGTPRVSVTRTRVPSGSSPSSNSTVVAASSSSTRPPADAQQLVLVDALDDAGARIGLAGGLDRPALPGLELDLGREPARELARIGQPAPGLVPLCREARSPASRSPCESPPPHATVRLH